MPSRSAETLRFDRWTICCVLCTVFLMVISWIELRRIEGGRLFLAALPWDRAPSDVEVLDAKASATNCIIPAMLSLSMIGTLVWFAAPGVVLQQQKTSKVWRPLMIAFVLAVLADLVTTIWFFHARGIDHEFHPGIRLFGYGFGRTVGPIAGKTVQAAGVIAVCLCWHRARLVLLSVVTLIYSVAAVFNVSQMWWIPPQFD